MQVNESVLHYLQIFVLKELKCFSEHVEMQVDEADLLLSQEDWVNLHVSISSSSSCLPVQLPAGHEVSGSSFHSSDQRSQRRPAELL